jgi:hypothetical protein
MTVLSPALDAELAKDRATIFFALQLDLAAASIKLLDASMALKTPFDGFVGEDPTYGALASLDSFEDGSGDEAPGLSFTINAPTKEAALAMSLESDQGARTRMWMGAANRATGEVIGDALLLLDGEMDVPTLNIGPNEQSVEYDAVSEMDRYFEVEEGITLSPTSHKTYWPDELGLDFVTGVTEPVYWGLSHSSAIQEK